MPNLNQIFTNYSITIRKILTTNL